jgi:hypothetical protein
MLQKVLTHASSDQATTTIPHQIASDHHDIVSHTTPQKYATPTQPPPQSPKDVFLTTTLHNINTI